MANEKISKNIDAYVPDSTAYYLGYSNADYKKPFAKYFDFNVDPISDEVQKGIVSSPWGSGLGYEASEGHDYLLRPGYLPVENGYLKTPQGAWMVACRTDMGQVTGEAYDWWFAWHSVESARYKLWYPTAHQYSWRHPEAVDIANKSFAERYYNTFSFIDEYIGGDHAKVTVAFIDPAELGIDKSKWPALGIETMIVARVGIGAHITEGFDGVSHLIHQIRRKADGTREMRSRFWLGPGIPETIAHDICVHCGTEMPHLAKILPQLFKEFRDEL
ncbi:hypothetical protein N7508_006002 [Penicillium antarcticum]|uniref:uncharacterized protein n=1 Tax=Penicillium antarcticum TaxID=416450 RepID=UPI00238CD4F3|nr:uncharacterized protein N7508_006002 [Penicillium antarcticum]KAJ5306987.1 hypothetical protein N7508_006002 [Penicillium antarcticum]